MSFFPSLRRRPRASPARLHVLSSRPQRTFADAWVGAVNIFPDNDGIVREYPAATFIDGKVQPAIATLVAAKSGLRDRTFQPDWAIDQSAIPRFSFMDVMNGRVSASALKGKRILVGATAVELGDRYAVPRFGTLPGVVIQALATESLLQDRTLQPTGILPTLIGILLIAFLLAPRPLDKPLRYTGLCVAIGAAVFAGPVLVEQRWPVSVQSAAWMFTACLAIAAQAIIEAKRRLWLRARFDSDSGLPNRSMLEQSLDACPAGGSVVVTAAVDRFDTIRDAIGLASTNDLVRKSADRLGALVESTVYRIAPDVVAWVQRDEAEVLASLPRIHSEFRRCVDTQAGPVDVSLTIGLENDHRASAPVLRIERALAAITDARSNGSSYQRHNIPLRSSRSQLSMMSDLRRAMTDGSLRLAYQPKMSLRTGAIDNCEALLRWHDGHAIISPDEFIPLAEDTGVIREVTLFAIRSALADLNGWARAGLPVRTAVNVSAVDLATQGFAEHVMRLLADADVPPSQLALEITESALIRSPAEAMAALAELRGHGIRLAVDDYGTGQSTLSYLKNLPVHELKIDKSFVTGIADSRSDQILVRSTIDLAHELGLEVVAEGIEDQVTLNMLRELGCDYAQGYFISRPLLPEALTQLCLTRNSSRPAA